MILTDNPPRANTDDGPEMIAGMIIALGTIFIGMPSLVAINIARYTNPLVGILAFVTLVALTIWGTSRALNPQNYRK